MRRTCRACTYHIVRGVLDTEGVKMAAERRSEYGARRPKSFGLFADAGRAKRPGETREGKTSMASPAMTRTTEKGGCSRRHSAEKRRSTPTRSTGMLVDIEARGMRWCTRFKESVAASMRLRRAST